MKIIPTLLARIFAVFGSSALAALAGGAIMDISLAKSAGMAGFMGRLLQGAWLFSVLRLQSLRLQTRRAGPVSIFQAGHGDWRSICGIGEQNRGLRGRVLPDRSRSDVPALRPP